MAESNKGFAIAWQAHLTRKENFYEILKCACHSPSMCNLLALALASLALALLALASLASVVSGTRQQVSRRYHAAN